jgi:Na+/melibiose symporter-like transporter
MDRPRGLLLAYAATAAPLALLGLPLYMLVPAYYAERVGLSLAGVGLVLLAARALDTATDPLVGWLWDRLSTRGQRRRLMLAAVPVLMAGVALLFRPGDDPGLAYLFAASFLVYAGWTLLAVPYAAVGAELSRDYHGRTRVSVYREALVIAGVLLGLTVYALGGAPRDALGALALLILVLLPLAVAVTLRAVPAPAAPGRWHFPWREVWRNRPFRHLSLAFLLNSTANAVPATLVVMYVEHVLGAGPWLGLFLGLYFLAGLLALPPALWLARRIGKHRTWGVSVVWACAAFAIVPWLGPGDHLAFALVCVLTGMSLGADVALPAAIQADVVEADGTGGYRSGVYFGLWGMLTKLSLALGAGIAFPLLDVLGYDAATGAVAALPLVYAGVPVAIKLLGLPLIWRFPLDARALAARRGEAAPATVGGSP